MKIWHDENEPEKEIFTKVIPKIKEGEVIRGHFIMCGQNNRVSDRTCMAAQNYIEKVLGLR